MLAFLRTIYAAIHFALVGLIGAIISLVRPTNASNVRIFARMLGWSALPLGLNITIRGKEHFDLHRPCVFISNHQHNIDIIPCGSIVPKRTASVGKKSLLYLPFFGLFYWLSGNILIDRKNHKSAMKTMKSMVDKITKKNVSVWMMPEGTRSKGRGILPFKKGAFHIAIQAQVPVVPVCINSYVKHLDLNRLKSATIILEAMPPVPTKGLTVKDVDSLKDTCRSLIVEGVAKLDNEVEKNPPV